jgi:hypothetical protein
MRMDAIELRERLGVILREEERENVDWETVGRMCRELPVLLAPDCPHFVHHYLSDSDIRAKDEVYGSEQRAEIRRFVETRQYVDSQEIPPWACLGVIAAVGAALFVALR